MYREEEEEAIVSCDICGGLFQKVDTDNCKECCKTFCYSCCDENDPEKCIDCQEFYDSTYCNS